MDNKNESKIQKMSHFQKLSPLHLQFQDLTYKIPQGRKGSKLLLQSINGQFRSGHLSAILGSSGSGKTSLLNALAGYKTIGVTGTLMVNGRQLVLNEFIQLSSYIMQQDLHQPLLTVQETMAIVADLKFHGELGLEDQAMVISEILESLRLTSAKNTLSDQLSGGERRRLSIALELINNPPVIFLDEPTTGLDEVASSQCISLLKALAEGGRTVICSIHTPSARIFEKFDSVYVMSEGSCVYQGYGQNLVTFLSNLGLHCPKHYNPADFVIEVTSGQYGDQYVDEMIKEMENGRNTTYCKDNSQEIEDMSQAEIISVPLKRRNEFFRQFKILLYRRCLQTYRNKQYLLLKILAYIFMGVFIGCFYFNVGQDVTRVHSNITFCLAIIMAVMYLSIMPICLYFPPEIKLLRREHFNKWYGLTAYYLVMSLVTLSINIIILFPSIGITYLMSNQIMELDRFILLILICSLVTLVADSKAMMMSSIFNVTHSLFVTVVFSCPLMLLSYYGTGTGGSIPLLGRIAMYLSYLRYALEGVILAIYGNGRSMLECPEEEIVCFYKDPKKIIGFVEMQHSFIWFDVLALVIWFFIFRITGFYILWIRLQTDHPLRSVKYLVQNLNRNKF